MSDKTDYDHDTTLCASVWFTPQAIRDHYEGGEPYDECSNGGWVTTATDEQLAAVGRRSVDWFLGDDRTWEHFHEVLSEAISNAIITQKIT